MHPEIISQNGELYAPWVQPRNLSAHSMGSIHEETTARQYGMRGALVTGRVLLEAFGPLLLHAFGPTWFERGVLGIEFRNGVLDGEDTRAVLAAPAADAPTTPVAARLERPSGELVGKGYAAAGSGVMPLWRSPAELGRYDTDAYTILAHLPPGFRFPDRSILLTQADAERMETAVPAMLWSSTPSPWNEPVASPALIVSTLTAPYMSYRREHPIAAVPVDGAFVLRVLAGPVYRDRPYRATGRVVARGHSPQTEYIWYESQLEDEQGRRVAEMQGQSRFMKGSLRPADPVRTVEESSTRAH